MRRQGRIHQTLMWVVKASNLKHSAGISTRGIEESEDLVRQCDVAGEVGLKR